MQHMESQGQTYNRRGYEGTRSDLEADDNFMEAVAQRVAHHTGKVQSTEIKQASAGQRLALAIVSVVMLTGAIAIISGPATSMGGAFGLVALGIVTLGIVLINAVFNRWWFR